MQQTPSLPFATLRPQLSASALTMVAPCLGRGIVSGLEAYAQENGMTARTIRVPLLDSFDIAALPYIQNGHVDMAPSALLAHKPGTLLILDDIQVLDPGILSHIVAALRTRLKGWISCRDAGGVGTELLSWHTVVITDPMPLYLKHPDDFGLLDILHDMAAA